ncbi:interleukin-10 [Vespertilionid gammaherpesvirus 1]|uniref:Viral interleukin-10 homolog n=1 Tax=Vespertilionid gammaherpesvirus 1 TaxID=2560830 RepID=A0A0X9Y7I4_9GAMA|nr:interleukin-10 [Myotis gammaherpesvirus 8]AMA67414.1 interleukin-10 [Vespertilionid gammaherpesvirus 1]
MGFLVVVGMGLILTLTEVPGAPVGQNTCNRVSQRIPGMLRELRTEFQTYEHLYDIDTDNLLLESYISQEFNGVLACQGVSDLMQFYLHDVMPQVESQNPKSVDLIRPLKEKLYSFRKIIRKCYKFLFCEFKNPATDEVKHKFIQLGDTGGIKAMSEFGVFLNYLELYLSNNA